MAKVKQEQNILRDKYGTQKMWVNYEVLQVGGRKTKVPFSPITKRKASSTDNKTWGTHAQALMFDAQHLGIVFTPEKTLLGIDIDHCLKANTNIIEHEKAQEIADLIIQADTYTEISPSGTGLHLYLQLTAPLSLTANRHENFEAYTAGRYFTVTNNSYKETKEVRTITPEEALTLLQIIGYPWGKVGGDVPLTLPKGQKVADQTPKVAPNASNSDAALLVRMFKSKNGKLIQDTYQGTNLASQYKNDNSVADMALLSHLAFWTGKNASQMESIWLSSPLGQREKTRERKDYRDRSIKTAILNCKTVYENKSAAIQKEIEDNAPDLELLFTISRGDKTFTQNTENMCRILRHHNMFKGRFRYDNFKNTLEISDQLDEIITWRVSEDHDILNVQSAISIIFPFFGKVGKEMIWDAIIKVSREHSIDTARDYVSKIKWDGTPRLKEWIEKTYHTDPHPTARKYYSAVGENWMKGLIKRICIPGCKFDYVLVLEGEQGIKKSTSLSIIGDVYHDQPNWHVETTMSTENKDFFMQFQGKAIIEFSEGETLSRTEVKRMKAIITMQSDKYRPAYGRLSVDFPRRCVFAMTTNQTEYLKDETGNRRWLPVACVGEADVEWLRENRDQLFAEAYHRVFTLKESTWDFPLEETMAMQSSRRIHSPNQDLVTDWYFNKLREDDRDNGITVHQVYRDALHGGMAMKSLSKFEEMEIADVLKNYLKLSKEQKMINGIRSMRWFIKADSMQSAAQQPGTELENLVEDLKGNGKLKF